MTEVESRLNGFALFNVTADADDYVNQIKPAAGRAATASTSGWVYS